ncbi:hypothetical protein RZS08_38010, partial [Arthrospira platensis SPKY1]|nr:hypothetical protein [Arthrospira platensis SPKY1]
NERFHTKAQSHEGFSELSAGIFFKMMPDRERRFQPPLFLQPLPSSLCKLRRTGRQRREEGEKSSIAALINHQIRMPQGWHCKPGSAASDH